MPFWKKHANRPSKKEIEQLQDAKLSLSENLPVHVLIVDLSKIYLSDLPYGVLSVIKHQNKECLILKENELKDLKGNLELLEDLLKLDISWNLFKSVPKNIVSLQSLVHLNLDHNLLSSLPRVIGSLPNLEILSARNNEIKTIAAEIGSLSKLITLNLTHNHITTLPDNFSHCYRLQNLEVDLENFKYPPAEVVMKGGRATVLWLCEENNVDKSRIDSTHDSHQTTLSEITNSERQAQEMVLKHQANQDAETAELMRQVKEDEESYMAMAKKTDKRETEHRERIRKTLAEEDKIERKKLSEYLKFQDDVKMANIKAALIEVEEKDLDADKIIAEIEKLHAEERERLKVYVAEDEAILRKYIECHQLDLSYISEEMKKVMAEDRMMDDFIQNTDKEMQKMFKQVRDNVADENKSAMERVSELEKDKASLMQMILEDEALQKQMFITTQQDQDKVYQALTGEIENVQENLMLLTMLEKHQLDMDDAAKEHIWSQRAEMAHLLTDLVKKQEERRHELEEAAKLIETQYQDELANFWLYQYQMLMASKPVQIIREEEEAMRAAHKVREIEGEMKQSNDVYPTPMTLPPAWSEGPSAPAPDTPPNKEPSAPRSGPTPAPNTPPDKEPSAPRSGPTPAPKPLGIQTEPTPKPLGIQTGIESETECCICLDNVPNVAFLPCGHVCCCEACGIVSICPMCRAEITNTIKLYFTQN